MLFNFDPPRYIVEEAAEKKNVINDIVQARRSYADVTRKNVLIMAMKNSRHRQ